MKPILSILIAVTLAVSFVFAAPWSLPEQATPLGNGVFYLGTAVDNGKVVEGYAFLRYKDNYHHRPGHAGGPGGGPGEKNTCYSVLAKGARWKTTEPWELNPANSGFASNVLIDVVDNANIEWNDASGFTIFGAGMSSDDPSTAGTMNDRNEVHFDAISDPNVIAVTTTWGIFSGPPHSRELVEWDQVYNKDLSWSNEEFGVAGAFDFENIAQHELGHSLGLGHPDSSCTEETMYAYASDGEIKKRTLNAGDIAGAQDLY